MKEREKSKREKDEEVNGQGERGVFRPHMEVVQQQQTNNGLLSASIDFLYHFDHNKC